MPIQNPRTCPICETSVPAGFPMGFCPKCLLSSASPAGKADVASSDSETTNALLPPSRIPTLETLRRAFPDLDIIEYLGSGGMGAVYKARQPRLNRLVALKIMTCKPGHEADFTLRFEREAQVLAKLNHPHIVIIYDFGELDEIRSEGDPLFYFIMEYVDGTDLARLIHASEMKPPQALAIVPQICEALQYAHDQGITHRDIKPANILIDQRGTVKIADFGLAKMAGDQDLHFHTGLTQTGTTLGTPHYMAPEQWENPDIVDHRADIYAVGVVFYEMLTGERPAGVFELPSKKSAVDKKLDGVVLRAMERNPDRRYQQASEIKRDVIRISEKQRHDPRRSTIKGHPKSRKKLITLGLGIVILVGAWFYLQRPVKEVINPHEPSSYNLELSATTLRPGRLQAAGLTAEGKPHDLTKFAAYDDFTDVGGGWYDWTALRANGQTISSNGQNDYQGIRRIVRGLLRKYAFIDHQGHLLVPTGFPIPTPKDLQNLEIVDANFGRDHGIVLTPDGKAFPYGKRYEMTMGDWSDPTGWNTPRWPAPPEAALRDVIDIAVTSTHAATLHRNGEVSLWGWEGMVPWPKTPELQRIIKIESDDDTLLALDNAGQVWTYYLPRSPSAYKAVSFDHKLKRITTSATDIRERFWRDKAGVWQSIRVEANLNLNKTPLPADSAFSISAGPFEGKVITSLLWIEPKTAALPPFTDREAAEWALTASSKSHRWADGENISVTLRLPDGTLQTIRQSNELPSGPFALTGISCVPADEQKKDSRMIAHVTDGQVQRLSQLKDLEALHLYGSISPHVLKQLKSFPNLKSASFPASQFTGDDLSSLQKHSLKFLRFFGLPVSNQSALEVLQTLPHLRELIFEGIFDLATAQALPPLPQLTKFGTSNNELMTDAMLPVLERKMPNLNVLSFDRCRNLQGNALGNLHQWSQLNSLTLTDTPVGDAALSALDGISSLTHLYLGYTRITDASVSILNRLPLVELAISETQITDEGLLRLAQIPSLKKLSATRYRSNTGYTDAGIDHFQKLRPDVEVIRSAVSTPDSSLAQPGELVALGSLRAGQPIDLSKAKGITDFTQVVLHDKGWVALRANGQTVSSDGRGERKNIVKICPGIETSFALIDDQNHVEIFARLESSEDLNASLPAGIQQIGVVNLLTDGHHALALLKDGTVRVWGNHYDNPRAVPEWLGREPWARPPAEALMRVKAIAITPLSASTVTDDGCLWTWGEPSLAGIPANALALQGKYTLVISRNSWSYDALTKDGCRVSLSPKSSEAQIGQPGIIGSAFAGSTIIHNRSDGKWYPNSWRAEAQSYLDAIEGYPASKFSLMFFEEENRISIGLLKINAE